MSNFSVSYNFPGGFLWGSTLRDDTLFLKENAPYLYQLKENNINAISVFLNWADYEPLKNNYDESLIDATRGFFSRLNTQNITPIAIFDLSEIPHWQNLERSRKNDTYSQEKLTFSKYLANAIVPYTKYFGFLISAKTASSQRLFETDLKTISEIRDHIRSVNDQTQTGIVFHADSFSNKGSFLSQILNKPGISGLKTSDIDFIGINTDPEMIKQIQTVFGEERKPLLVYSDQLSLKPNNLRTETLITNIYEMWYIYQKGWPILGYFSDIDISENSTLKELFSTISKTNALELSAADPELPEKWIRFLKD